MPSSLFFHSVAGGKSIRSDTARSWRKKARSRFGLVCACVESGGKASLSVEWESGAGNRTYRITSGWKTYRYVLRRVGEAKDYQ